MLTAAAAAIALTIPVCLVMSPVRVEDGDERGLLARAELA